MTHSPLLALIAASLVLAACGTQPKAPPSHPSGQVQNSQLELALASGTYNCENGVSVRVERDIRDRVNHRIKIAWNGNSYRLERDSSNSGLPRFKDAANSLVWIDLPWKGLLLDGRTNQPLANECRSI